MQIWTFLHILFMFGAVTVAVGSLLWATSAIRGRDLGSLRAYVRVSGRAHTLSGVLLIAGIVFGLIAAMVMGFDLLQGWLVAVYILLALTLVVGFAATPYLNRLKAALEANEGDAPGPELEKLLASPVAPIATAVSIVLIGAIIYDMVFKPF